MPNKKFNNPLDDDELWLDMNSSNDEAAPPADLSLDFDAFSPTPSSTPSTPKAKPQPRSIPRKRPSTPQRQKPDQSASMEETLFYATHGHFDRNKKRPKVGNYQFVNLLVRYDVDEYLHQAAIDERMDFAPFMRWVLDQVALMVRDGLRPTENKIDEDGTKKRMPALITPELHDVFRIWAKSERMKFQTFMRWALFEFIDVYEKGQLHPQEPEEYLPGEAKLIYWASTKVQKFYGSGLAMDQRDE